MAKGWLFDPKGLAIVNVMAGYLAGKYLQQKGSSCEGIARLLLSGVLLVFIAYRRNFYFL